MTAAKRKRTGHPLYGVGFVRWLRMLATNGGVDREFFATATAITARSLALAPLRAYEALASSRAVARTDVVHPPLFIVGHWRSGTTLLQNLLCRDPRVGYLTVAQSIFPTIFLSAEASIEASIPTGKRQMDSVLTSGGAPSEEEIALALLAPGSMWHGYYFPRRMEEHFTRWVLFDGITPRQKRRWESAYRTLLRKLTLRHGGKPLVLKNPSNTARIATLIQMFPEARFVHIHRDPLRVFLSRMGQYDNSIAAKRLQSLTAGEWQEQTLKFYEWMMRRYLRDRALVPAGQLVEIAFEDLARDRMGCVRHIYEALSLPDFAGAEEAIGAYAATLSDYRLNRYDVEPAVEALVRRRWEFAYEAFGYGLTARTST